MDAFDKIEEQLLAKGYSKEEIPAIMVSLVEQSGVKVTPDLLPDKLDPKAPKPEFGPDRVRPRVRGTRPAVRKPGDPAPRPNFGNNQPRTNAGGATNIPRTNANTRVVQQPAPAPNFRTNPTGPVASTATKGKGLFGRLVPRIAPVAKQAYAAYRGTERMSKGDYLGAALGYGTAIPGLPGNVSMVADLLRGDPEVNNPDAFKPIPKRPNESDAGTSTATSGLSGFPKNTPQPDAYQSRPTSTKSDFERRQAEVLRAQQRSVSATQQQVDKDNQRYGNTVPSGSFGISQQGRAQAAANRAAVQPKVAPTPPAPPQKTARQLELDSINADKNLTPMQKWAKANPKLAAAKAERDRTRGTSASTNPMLDGNNKVPGLRIGMRIPK